MAGNRRVWWRATEGFGGGQQKGLVAGYRGMGGGGGVGGRQMASRMTKEKGKTIKEKGKQDEKGEREDDKG